MAVDIYIRGPEDPNFMDSEVELTEELDIFLSELEMILLTPKTEVMGSFGFGASLDKYIHSFNYSAAQLQREINNQISEYSRYASKFKYSVNVQFIRGTVRDIGLVDVVIDNTKVFGIMIK